MMIVYHGQSPKNGSPMLSGWFFVAKTREMAELFGPTITLEVPDKMLRADPEAVAFADRRLTGTESLEVTGSAMLPTCHFPTMFN